MEVLGRVKIGDKDKYSKHLFFKAIYHRLSKELDLSEYNSRLIFNSKKMSIIVDRHEIVTAKPVGNDCLQIETSSPLLLFITDIIIGRISRSEYRIRYHKNQNKKIRNRLFVSF